MPRERKPSVAGLRWPVVFGVGAIAILVLRLWRGFFWSHAVIVGLAITALVYSAWRTWERR